MGFLFYNLNSENSLRFPIRSAILPMHTTTPHAHFKHNPLNIFKLDSNKGLGETFFFSNVSNWYSETEGWELIQRTGKPHCLWEPTTADTPNPLPYICRPTIRTVKILRNYYTPAIEELSLATKTTHCWRSGRKQTWEWEIGGGSCLNVVLHNRNPDASEKKNQKCIKTHISRRQNPHQALSKPRSGVVKTHIRK